LLKYATSSVTYTEVPDELSLTYAITGCKGNCEGCHSAHLRENTGKDLLPDLKKDILKYKGLITTVCFLGGDDNINGLKRAINEVKKLGLKTALYTRRQQTLFENEVDFLKTGPYIEKYGGLNKPNTNQRMFKIIDDNKVDITHKFLNVYK
jgi:anaerobic ribonucleoside-triphosphate reductase activating protein